MKKPLIVASICLVAAFLMRSELSYTPDLNDNVLHLTLIKGMTQAVETGHNPFDFWSPEIGLGQPIVKLYEPLGHALVVAIYFLSFKLIPLLTVFLWLKLLSVVLLPVTFYYTAKLLDMPNSAVYAAALCLLVSSDMFGIELGSYTWGGHGLFPQALATHLLLLAIGSGWQTFQHNRHWINPAIALAVTGWTNLLYGYVGGITMLAIMACSNKLDIRERLRRLGEIALFSGACAAPKLWAWATTPGLSQAVMTGRPEWRDSYGSQKIVMNLFTGEIFDHGRFPVFTVMVVFGIVAAVVYRMPNTRLLLAGVSVWFLLYFGRPTWGDLLYLVGIMPAMSIHRFIGPLHVFSILLAALGISWAVANCGRWVQVVIALALLVCASERATMLKQNAQWMDANRAYFAADWPAINHAIEIAKQRGGRVYAGMPYNWGKDFRIGQVPVYGLFPPSQVPSVGFLYMSLLKSNMDMYEFDDSKPEQYANYDIRTVIGPAGMVPVAGMRLLANLGRFVVYGAGQ